MPRGIYPRTLEHNEKLSKAMKGTKNAWKGENAGYRAIHIWVQRTFGLAKICERCKSTVKIEWANRDHKYKRIRRDWMQLCRKCHAAYDSNRRKRL